MPNIALNTISIDIRKKELQPSFLILKHTFSSSHSFLNAFTELRTGKRGPCTDKEQDILRAMLIFSASGLDAMIKQLIKDNLETIIENNAGTHIEFEKYTIRVLKQRSIEDENDNLDLKFLSQLLTSSSPKNELINRYKEHLISGSLQSGESILRVGACLDIPSENISKNFDDLKKVFESRNEIIHEMDIDFDQPSQKTRHQRTRTEMIKMTNIILESAEKFLSAINKKI